MIYARGAVEPASRIALKMKLTGFCKKNIKKDPPIESELTKNIQLQYNTGGMEMSSFYERKSFEQNENHYLHPSSCDDSSKKCFFCDEEILEGETFDSFSNWTQNKKLPDTIFVHHMCRDGYFDEIWEDLCESEKEGLLKGGGVI